jgi:molecular chaperone GrpE (heat shock protein)
LSRLIAGQIEQFLAVEGVERINAEGALFDKAVHKPVGTVECLDASKHNSVRDVVRHGFRSEHSVLRPAEVKLAKYKEPPDPANDGGGQTEEER